jgi:pyrroloquinoline quinone biosynthesis protein B
MTKPLRGTSDLARRAGDGDGGNYLRAIVLGSGAGGGSPQWNCACRVCRLAWNGHPSVKPRSQSSVAVSLDGDRWLLLNASIDLRQQVLATPALHPRGAARDSPVAAVLITNGDVDHIGGLLTLREREALTLWGTRTTLETIGANRIFDALARDIVPRRPVALGFKFDALPGLSVELFAAPGKVPLWMEEGDVPIGVESEATVGVRIEAQGRRLLYIPGCAAKSESVREQIEQADVLLFDGTLYDDDEMIRAGLGEKTSRRMGHMPISGSGGSLEQFARYRDLRRIYIHINNTNPILIDGSDEAAAVAAAGWEIACDGMEIEP